MASWRDVRIAELERKLAERDAPLAERDVEVIRLWGQFEAPPARLARDIDAQSKHGLPVAGDVLARRFEVAQGGALVDHADFAARAEARAAICEPVEVFYHRQRRRSHLGDQAPAEFEE